MKRRSKRRNKNKNNCAVFYKNSIKFYWGLCLAAACVLCLCLKSRSSSCALLCMWLWVLFSVFFHSYRRASWGMMTKL
jgi:hypothetical protein